MVPGRRGRLPRGPQGGRLQSASTLLSSKCAKVLQASDVPGVLPEDLLYKLLGDSVDIVTVTISKEAISPDGNESRFKGQVERLGDTQAFVLRVVKETKSGLWRVDFFHADKAQDKPKNPSK